MFCGVHPVVFPFGSFLVLGGNLSSSLPSLQRRILISGMAKTPAIAAELI
jgi:hypothetical protein